MFRNRYEMNLNKIFIKIFINRKTLFFDAYDQIMYKSSQELKQKLYIKYIGEKGVDASGLLK